MMALIGSGFEPDVGGAELDGGGSVVVVVVVKGLVGTDAAFNESNVSAISQGPTVILPKANEETRSESGIERKAAMEGSDGNV
jgi:hypothetical protein